MCWYSTSFSSSSSFSSSPFSSSMHVFLFHVFFNRGWWRVCPCRHRCLRSRVRRRRFRGLGLISTGDILSPLWSLVLGGHFLGDHKLVDHKFGCCTACLMRNLLAPSRFRDLRLSLSDCPSRILWHCALTRSIWPRLVVGIIGWSAHRVCHRLHHFVSFGMVEIVGVSWIQGINACTHRVLYTYWSSQLRELGVISCMPIFRWHGEEFWNEQESTVLLWDCEWMALRDQESSAGGRWCNSLLREQHRKEDSDTQSSRVMRLLSLCHSEALELSLIACKYLSLMMDCRDPPSTIAEGESTTKFGFLVIVSGSEVEVTEIDLWGSFFMRWSLYSHPYSSTMKNVQLLELIKYWNLSPKMRNRSSYIQALQEFSADRSSWTQ